MIDDPTARAEPSRAHERSSVLPNVVFTFLGTTATAGAQFVAVILLARLATPAAVGVWTLAQAICTPFMLLASFSLRKVQATDTAHRFTFGEYATLRLMSSALTVMLLSAYAFVSRGLGEAALTVIIVAAARGVDSLSDLVHGALQRAECMARIAASQIVSAAVFVSCAVPLALYHASALRIAAAMLTGSAAAFVIVDVASYRWMRSMQVVDPMLERRRPGAPWELAVLAAPLGAATSLTSLVVNVPRLLLEWIRGSATLGVFAAVHYIVICVNLFVGAVAQAVLPGLARHIHLGERRELSALLSRLIVLCAALSATIIVGAYWAGPAILRRVYGDAYAGSATILNVLAIATGVGVFNWFLDYIVTAAGSYQNQLAITAAAVGGAAITGLLTIPKYGATGAAFSLLIAVTMQVLPRLALTKRLLFPSPSDES